MHTVTLSLGSNLGDRKMYLRQAVGLLEKEAGTVIKQSSVYETDSWGFDSFPFLNQVVVLSTDLSPFELLERIKEMEIRLGRDKKSVKEGSQAVYSDRTIDIDILFFDDLEIRSEELTIPHPKIAERDFVLLPLRELGIPVPDNNRTSLRYKYIAIEGCIGAGKTELARKLSLDLGTELILETFSDNTFLPLFYREPRQYAFHVETAFLMARYEQLKTLFSQTSFSFRNKIADYFFDKCFIFAKNNLSSDEWELYSRLFETLKPMLPKPDLILYLHTSPARLLQNIRKRGRSYETGIRENYLEDIQQNYLSYLNNYTDSPVLILETSEMDFIGNEEDYHRIKSLLEKDFPTEINRLDIS